MGVQLVYKKLGQKKLTNVTKNKLLKVHSLI